MYIGLHVTNQLFLSDFNGTWIFWQILKKYSNIKFNENTSSGTSATPCGQTNRHDEANSHFSWLCECA